MKGAVLYVLFHTSATNSPASTSIVATRDDAADIDGEVKEGVGDEKMMPKIIALTRCL
jgi:hypothetical protein